MQRLEAALRSQCWGELCGLSSQPPRVRSQSERAKPLATQEVITGRQPTDTHGTVWGRKSHARRGCINERNIRVVPAPPRVCVAPSFAYKRPRGSGRGKMRRRRRLWIILLATPLVLLAADTLYWWIAVSNLEHGFAAWQAEQTGRGLERTAWCADTRRLAAGGSADCSRDVARARRPRQSRQAGMERGPAGAACRLGAARTAGNRGRGQATAAPGGIPRRCPSPPTDCASCCRCARNRGRRSRMSSRTICTPIRRSAAMPACGPCACIWTSVRRRNPVRRRWSFRSEPRRSARHRASSGRSVRASRTWRWMAR